MKLFFLLHIAATLALAAPLCAQNAAGWTAQTRDNGARTLVPPDLQTGEVYSVTIYPTAALGNQSLADYLRKFAGVVGKNPGNLAAPLNISNSQVKAATGVGVYVGPNGTALSALFGAVSLDGRNVAIVRTLFSSEALLARYRDDNNAILQAAIEDLRDASGAPVPDNVMAKLKVGGALVPGVYAGNRVKDGQVTGSYRVYLYANGQSRVTDSADADLKGSYGSILGVGDYKYNANSGRLDLDRFSDISNGDGGDKYAYYGRDSAGRAMIIAGNNILNAQITLVYAGPPTKRPSPATMDAREAEARRFKFVAATGKGVPSADIAAIVSDYVVRFDGMSSNITNDVYLLLRDGTIYNQLPVAPDQLDAAKSRQGEPEKWGKWRAKGAGYEVSWNGKPYQTLPGDKALPAPAGTKLTGRYGAVRSYSYGFGGSYSFWGATFDKSGRFRKDGRGGSSTNTAGIEGLPTVTTGYDESGSSVVGQADGAGISSIKKKNLNGANEGDYSVNGYVITLRFDNGQVERMPFFFRRANRKQILFEGDILDVEVTD